MNRYRSREQAFTLIFQSEFSGDDAESIIEAAQLAEDTEISEFASGALKGIRENSEIINHYIEKHIKGWKSERLSKMSSAIMKLSVYEMLFEEGVPIAVSINEAVELAKKYGDGGDASYVNGVLGAIGKDIKAEQGKAKEKK